jgi:hypothetical protein
VKNTCRQAVRQVFLFDIRNAASDHFIEKASEQSKAVADVIVMPGGEAQELGEVASPRNDLARARVVRRNSPDGNSAINLAVLLGCQRIE